MRVGESKFTKKMIDGHEVRVLAIRYSKQVGYRKVAVTSYEIRTGDGIGQPVAHGLSWKSAVGRFRKRIADIEAGLDPTEQNPSVTASRATAPADARSHHMNTKTLPLPVTYHVGALAVPATVTRLLKPYFEVVVSEYVSEGGNLRPAETVKLDYRGAPYGTQGRRVPKKYQSRTPPRALPGVYGKDLAAVRVLSGRSPH